MEIAVGIILNNFLSFFLFLMKKAFEIVVIGVLGLG